MKFIPDHQVNAFAALQKEVEEALSKIEHNLQQVFVQQYDSEAQLELCFYGNGRRVGVGYFHAPASREGLQPSLSWFSVICHEASIGQTTPTAVPEKAYFHFAQEFFDDHVKKVSQEVIHCLVG